MREAAFIMVLRLTALFVFLSFGLLGVTVQAATVVETEWKEISQCIDDGLGLADDGLDRERIRLTRRLSDGTIQNKFMWRFCEDECECWHEGEWANVGTFPTDGLPVHVNTSGDWILLGVTVGKGGGFVPGVGSTWDFILDPFSTSIFLPAIIVS